MVSTAMVGSTWRARTKSFFTGEGLFYLSKALLQSGQVYYLSVFWLHLCQYIYWSNLYASITIGVAIFASALVLSGNIPRPFHPILSSPYFALGSAMACRVFRIVILGIMEDTRVNTLGIGNFNRSATSDLLHHDDGNDERGRLPKFEMFVGGKYNNNRV